MKLTALSLITGVITVALTASPYSLQAQAHSPSLLLIAQDDQDKGPLSQLNLTDEQKHQIEHINQNTSQKIHQQLNLPAGEQINYKSLSPDQKQQVREIQKQAKQEIYRKVLTDAQRQQVDQYRQNHHHTGN